MISDIGDVEVAYDHLWEVLKIGKVVLIVVRKIKADHKRANYMEHEDW